MEKDLLKIFILEMKIDTNLNKVTETINIFYDYFDNKWNNDLEDKDIAYMLEETEYFIKDTKNLLDKLAEEYEKYYIK